MFKLINKSGKARYCEFKANNKTIKTPFFMTAATKAAIRHLRTEEFKELGGDALIANSMLLSLKPGAGFIKENKGIHRFINFDGIIFTDSGGFQVIRQFCEKIEKNGIWFKSPYDGKKHFTDPKTCMNNQIDLNSDVAMCLDHMPLSGATRSQALFSLNRTTDWAKLCKKKHDELKQQSNSKQLLFGIAQGGIYPDLRKISIEEIIKIGFDGYALGGLAIGEPKQDMFNMIKLCGKILPKNKLRYVMGIGNPLDIVEAVSLGIDCFDSVYPTQCARHNHLFTTNGILRLDKKQYREDKAPLDKNCNCEVCQNYTRAYIHYLTKINESVAYQLKTYHNLYFIYQLMKDMQLAIKEDRFNEFRAMFKKKFII